MVENSVHTMIEEDINDIKARLISMTFTMLLNKSKATKVMGI